MLLELPDPIAWTQEQAASLGQFARAQLLPGAGSERCYWRLARAEGGKGGESLLLMRYGPEREENAGFAPLTRWLAGRGLRVPQIFAEEADPERGGGWIWLEDFGDQDLRARVRADPAAADELYRQVAEEIARWHAEDLSGLPDEAQNHLQRSFDEDLYLWEQQYFWEQGIGRLGDLPTSQIEALRQHSALRELAVELAALPRVPIHRDFQSTNVMVGAQGGIGIIDYQGLREGLAEYDLASLIYDPYLPYDEARAALVLARYAAARGLDLGELTRQVQRVALQRLMQALGAYGKLGLGDGKPQFLAFVRPCRERLAMLSAGTEFEQALSPALASLAKW